MDVAAQALCHRQLGEPALDRARRDPFAALADEERLRVGARQAGSHREPGAHRGCRRGAYRNDPLLRALAPDADLARREIDALDIETGKLGQTQARRIRELEERAVAQRKRIVTANLDEAHRFVGRQRRR